MPKLFFERGERYVLYREKGTGKSSILAKINQIIHDGIDYQAV